MRVTVHSSSSVPHAHSKDSNRLGSILGPRVIETTILQLHRPESLQKGQKELASGHGQKGFRAYRGKTVPRLHGINALGMGYTS